MTEEKFRAYEGKLRTLATSYANKHHCVGVNEMRTEIYKRLNALIYRSASVLWNYHQLNGLIRKTRISIANQRNRDEIVPEIMNSLFPISYNFDDIIFNLISMFDYLAGVIGLVLTEDTFKWYKWNQLVRTHQK